MIAIAAVPHFVYAGLTCPTLFFVYASTVVEATDPAYRPVAEFLGLNCNVLLWVREEQDPDMMFGGVWHSVYAIFPECPGPEVPHACSVLPYQPTQTSD